MRSPPRRRLSTIAVVALGLAACGKAAPHPPQLVAITVAEPGASAHDIEASIVVPIEDAVGELPGVVSLTARAEAGRGTIVVVGDRDDLAAAVHARVGSIAARLPRGASPPEIRQTDPDAPFAITYRVAGTAPPSSLAELARDLLRPRLERLAGVAGVEVRGAPVRRLELHVDAARLASLDLTLADLARAVEASHVDVPAGRIERGATELRVRHMPPAALAAIPLATADGRPLRLGDVVQLEQVDRPPPVLEPLHVGLRLQRGADREATLAAVEAELARIRAELPPGVELRAHVPDPAPPRFVLRGPDREVLGSLVREPPAAASASLSIDRDRAADRGLDVATLARTLALAAGEPVAGDDRTPIVFAISDPRALRVRAATGLIPLADVVVEHRTSAATLERVDRMPAVVVADPSGLPRELPAGYTLRPLRPALP